jgi:gag-polypeptide of LTR copia-type
MKEMYLGTNKVDVPKTADSLTVGKDDDKIKVRDMNEMAYSDLIMAMDTSTKQGMVAFNLVMSSKTTEFRDGHAGISWKRLLLKYQPDTGCQLTKLHKQFYASTLKPGQDPDVWITSLEHIRVQMETLGSKMSDANFSMYVVNNAPPEYDEIIDILSRHIGTATDALKIEELRSEMNLRLE